MIETQRDGQKVYMFCSLFFNAFILSVYVLANIRSEIDDILRPHNESIVLSIVRKKTINTALRPLDVVSREANPKVEPQTSFRISLHMETHEKT